MSTHFRNAVMSGLYGVAAIAEAQRNHRKEQAALDKAKWQARYSERDQQMQMEQQQNEYLHSQERLNKDREALTNNQAKFQVQQDQWKEEQRLREDTLKERVEGNKTSADIRQQNADSLKMQREEQSRLRERDLTRKDRETTIKEQADNAAKSKKYVTTTQGLSKMLTDTIKTVITSKRRSLSSMMKNEPEDFMDEVMTEVERIMRPSINLYNMGARGRNLEYSQNPQGAQRIEQELTWQDLIAGNQEAAEQEIQSVMREEATSVLEKMDDDPTFVERLQSGELTDEEVAAIKDYDEEMYHSYMLRVRRSQAAETKIPTTTKERLEQLAGAKGD